MKYSTLIICSLALFLGSCGNKKSTEKGGSKDSTQTPTVKDTCRYDQEKHLANLKMLTFGGENAEAYWSFDGTKFSFQRTLQEDSIFCDQIFMWKLADGDMRTQKPTLISTGKGRTTCSYFLPGDSLILYASTHKAGDACPETPERKKGAYYWPIYETMDIYVSNLKGEVVNQLTNKKGYDAEATVSPKGDKIVFTSDRSGDLELYTMNIDVKQITNELGYDGGAFFSPDGTKIVYRASRPTADTTVKKYKDLLKKHLVEPSDMEIFVCNIDGTDKKQITHLGKANWAPFFHPSGNKIIFSSNHKSPKEFMFNLWMINLDGTGLEQITFDPVFDAFPMFSPDGKKILFSSNRNNGGTRSTNLFVADWVD
jgi:TolB protein